MTDPPFDASTFEPPPPGTLCDICHEREATGGTSFKEGGEMVNHCDTCEYQVPVGQSSWYRAGGSDRSSPRDPDGLCDNCGVQGTVARVTRRGREVVVRRYCRTCWPAMRAKAESEQELISKQWLSAGSRPRSFLERRMPMLRPDSIMWESRHWGDTIEMIEMLLGSSTIEFDAEVFARIAAEIVEQADDMDGPMPPEIAAFVNKYGQPAG